MKDANMLLVSLKDHFPARLPEWWGALVLTVWGTYTVMHPSIFYEEPTRSMVIGMASMASWTIYPHLAWGLGALVMGLVRFFALFVNGAYTRTPLIRFVVSFLACFIWTQVSIGFFKSGVANWGCIIYPLLVVLDVASCVRAANDVPFAERLRRDLNKKRSLSRGGHSFIS